MRNTSSLISFFLFLLLLGLGIWLRFYGLQDASVRSIEELSRLAFRHHSWLEMMRMQDPVHVYSFIPVTIQYLIHQNYDGATLILRQASFLFGVLSLPLVYHFAKSLYGQTAGFYALALFALLPWPILISRWATPYSLIVLITLMSAAIFVKILKELKAREGPEPLSWAQYLIILVLLSYVHHLGIILALSLAIATAGFAVGSRSHLSASYILIILLITVNLPQFFLLHLRPTVITSDLYDAFSLANTPFASGVSLALLTGLVAIIGLAFIKRVYSKSEESTNTLGSTDSLLMLSLPAISLVALVADRIWGFVALIDFLALAMPVLLLLGARALQLLFKPNLAGRIMGIIFFATLAISSFVLI